MKKSYEDILYCKRPVSKNHPPMSRESRAAQFGSFAALSGYEEAVNEAGRLTDQKIELDENAKGEAGLADPHIADADGEKSGSRGCAFCTGSKEGGRPV